MLKRTISMLLSITWLMCSFGIMYIHAENNSDPTIQAVSPEAVTEAETNASAATPEVVNITSGSVLLELGKTYLLVHDEWEILNIYSFSSIATNTGTNTIITNEEGSATLSIMYLNSEGFLSSFALQIEVLDISGTIDLANSSVFVEKGKNYWMIHSEQTPITINSTNHNIVTTNGSRVLVAVDTGSTNLSYYYTENGNSVYEVCEVDVYAPVDINSLKTSASDLFFITVQSSISGSLYAINQATEATSHTPTLQFVNYSKYSEQTFKITPTTDGYCYIYSPYKSAFLVINSSVASTDAAIMFSSSLLFDGSQIYKWKFIKKDDTTLLLLPQHAEDAQLVLTCDDTSLTRNDTLALQPYANTANRRTWDLYNSTFYVNNYFEYSLYDYVGPDAIITNLIDDANNFAQHVFNMSFPSPLVSMGSSPSYVSDFVTSQCPTGLYNNCDDVLCSSNHSHKNINIVHRNIKQNIDRKNNEISVMWADRQVGTFCSHDANGPCSASYAAGCTPGLQNDRNIVLICSVSNYLVYNQETVFTEEKFKVLMGIVLAHEISHTLGINERYTVDTHRLDNEIYFQDSCVCIMEGYTGIENMTDFYNDVIEGRTEPFCESCISDIVSTINNYFYKGNQ